MSDLRKAAQQALDRLRKYHHGNGFVEDAECIVALEAALAQQHEPAQEPVAWRHKGAGHFAVTPLASKSQEWEPLYTTPPQRPPLTDEEMRKLWSQYGYKSALCMRFARAIERKVRGE